jgi:predicted TIM-barrel fold metal-dependent hydrolase
MTDPQRRTFLKHTAVAAALGSPAIVVAGRAAETTAHGGALPFLIGRVDHQTQVLKRGPKNLRHAPSEYLRRVWFDIVSPLPLAMKFAYDFLGPDRLLFASDHPWVEPKLIRDTFEAVEMPADDRQKIASLNARSLFRL